jgi:hypothetical protein
LLPAPENRQPNSDAATTNSLGVKGWKNLFITMPISRYAMVKEASSPEMELRLDFTVRRREWLFRGAARDYQ